MPSPADNGVSSRIGAQASSVRTIALMNQKGGVGKTTTTVNLAAGIAERKRSTLVVDLDPQAHATLHLGVEPPAADHARSDARSVYDLLADPTLDPRPAIRRVNEYLAVLPAETDMAGLETELSAIDPAERSTRLRRVLGALGSEFEFVLLDCPPSLGVLTLNGLAAAGEVFIPLQAHFLALQGVSKLLETVSLVGQSVNPSLRVTGIILCMHDVSSTHSREVVNDLTGFLEAARADAGSVPWRDARILEPPIRRNIKLAECPSFGKSIFDYAPWCPGALDYRALAEGVVVEWDARQAAKPTTARVEQAAAKVVVPRRSAAARSSLEAGT